MVYCNDCKRFVKPIEKPMDKETGFIETVCPLCGSDYLEEADLCVCGEAYTTGDFCDNCYEKVNLSLNALKEELGFTQDDFEQIIANHFGW